MAEFDLPRLLFLVVLGAAVIGWFISEYRGSLGQGVRMALAWGMIFLGLVAGFGLWGDTQSQFSRTSATFTDSAIIVPRGPNGHFNLTAELNGAPVRFVVDTGATDIVLTQEDARRVGLDPDGLVYAGIAATANGTVRTAFARVDEMVLGPVAITDVGVSVNEGELFSSLLGMSFLNRFERIEIAEGQLRLEP